MRIKTFIFLLNLGIVGILSLFIYFIYTEQQSKTVAVIIENIKKDLQDSSYIASKILNKNNDVYFLRPVLDRKVAKNDLIRGFVLADGNKKLFVSGDVDLKVPENNVKKNINDITLKDLLEKKAFVIPIKFYKQNKQKVYDLYVFLNKDKLKSMFVDLKVKYLVFYFMIISAIFFILNYMVQYYLINPLLRLKLYAEKKDFEPKFIPIKEINDIKNALTQSFKELDTIINNLYKSSITDFLTGLGNKKLLLKEVEKRIKKGQKFCLLFLDLDNFKEINDFYGHSVGDALIIEVANELKNFVKSDEVITRIGGDEFILLLNDCDTIELNKRLNELLKRLDKKWIIRNYELSTSASVGVAIYPHDGKSFDELLKNADIAMYEAKHRGRNKYVIFNTDVKEKISKEYTIKTMLQKAIENEEFELFYQPKLDRNKRVVGCEALIRWIKDGKVVPPGEFIPVAEKSGLIYEIGKWVIEESAKRVQEWESDEILKEISLAFNVSVVQMRREGFLNDVRNIISKIKPNVSNLEIEITESVFIENKQRALHLLELLKRMGFKINLDDFGTGYSSISVLKEFKIDILKIDKSFVDEVLSKEGRVYVKTIIDMSKNLNLLTVAEGVEYQEQFEVLKELGVDYFQGYLFAKPLKKEEFEEFVKKLNTSKF
ncbi:putative bifunctional diguanylate cyclase/phosphodiesterase [Caminibacter pacificus]|nr:EAL domain-containing protein [Caminibacter pacificus]ROR39386.1 diguanylate cyclase (GGDEF)-like protein [Caminibacter pacificus]